MRVLFICNKSPYPAKEGGPIAMNAMIQGVVEAGHHVKVIAVNTDKYSVDINAISADYQRYTNISFVNLTLKINPVEAFINLFSQKSLHIIRFITDEFRTAIKTALLKDEYDIVQFETLYVSPFIDVIRTYSKAKIVLRAHNVEHVIWERIRDNEKNPVKRWYLSHIAKTLKNYELKTITQVDGIAAITEVDANTFSQYNGCAPIAAFPFSVDLANFPLKKSEEKNPLSFFHLGSMDWMPNQEGISWFLKNVWNTFVAQYPTATFRLAGRNMPANLLHLKQQGVEVIGEVENAYTFMQENGTMIVPLFSGSGIRIKIIEGMAQGVPIITTPIGAEGIEVTHRKDILLADNTQDFINIMCDYVTNNKQYISLGNEARRTIEKYHDNSKTIAKLLQFYKEI